MTYYNLAILLGEVFTRTDSRSINDPVKLVGLLGHCHNTSLLGDLLLGALSWPSKRYMIARGCSLLGEVLLGHLSWPSKRYMITRICSLLGVVTRIFPPQT